MKLDRISLNRKFNLGNYETLDVGLEAQLGEKDNPLDVWKQLEDLAEMYVQTRSAKSEEKPVATPEPQPELQQTPAFDSEELMKHKWKGKRTGEGTYAEGSLNWGWDFRDQFSKATIAVLEKGPLQIDQYEFSLTNTLVSVKKKKT
jgi:hypothetical protein